MENPFTLKGKVAIITGSSRGIGKATAELFALMGAKVVVSSRKADACEEVAAAIRANGGEASVIACNITRKAEVEHLVAETLKIYGKIDILVCNAAVNPVYGAMSTITDEAFDKIMGANVKSNIWFTNLCIPHIKAAGGGAVVIVSSIAGLRGNDVIGTYGISKAADFALCRNLAFEHGKDGVRVNCVAPGLIRTDFAKALMEDEKALAYRNRHTPLRRVGEPKEIASVVAFLSSPASSFMTGEVVVADGGVTIA